VPGTVCPVPKVLRLLNSGSRSMQAGSQSGCKTTVKVAGFVQNLPAYPRRVGIVKTDQD